MRCLRHSIFAWARLAVAQVVTISLLAPTARSEDPIPGSDASLESIVALQSEQLRELRERLDRQEGLLGLQPAAEGGLTCTPELIERVPLVAELPADSHCDSDPAGRTFKKLRFYADYDRGFVIRPFDQSKFPFDIKLNGWGQFRHHGFTRRSDSWTDNAGVTRPIRNRNVFDIERARLAIRGHAVDPRLTYFIQLDGDTDGFHTVDFFDCWFAWRFTDRFQIQFGKRKVPASRRWLLSARLTRLVDRPVAVDSFRPDRTVGVFAVGEVGKNGHYELMIGNGYRTANLPNAVTDNRFTFAATGYVDPAGDFGNQVVDFDCSSDAKWRLGHSFVYSPQATEEFGIPLDESDFLRLADGTRLTQAGALAPGTTVSEFDLWLYGVDLHWKYRGWSASSEIFVRLIDQLGADGALPTEDVFQNGCYLEGGRFLVPREFETNVRYSYVSGDFGTRPNSPRGSTGTRSPNPRSRFLLM